MKDTAQVPARWRIWPLYAAGFTTAFGAHAIAANLSSETGDVGSSLLYLGVLLAVYDGAEVVLKPVFGSIADHIGARKVLLGGLVAFVSTSVAFAALPDGNWLWLVRLGQGAAAAAFSPAASSMIARLHPNGKQGRAFGSYGSFKSIGYAAGPVVGGLLVWGGDLRLLFAATALLAVVVLVWAACCVPTVAPLPRTRQTVLDLARRLGDRSFLTPTVALAAAAAAMSVGVGFLPVSGALAGLGPVATGAAVSVLAACGVVAQPLTGRALDSGRLTAHRGFVSGLLITAGGLALAMLPGVAAVVLAAIAIGVGTGMITPTGFATLAGGTPANRMGQTMGAAEIGRELGDAGGPLIVAGAAAIGTLTVGYGVISVITALLRTAVRPENRVEPK